MPNANRKVLTLKGTNAKTLQELQHNLQRHVAPLSTNSDVLEADLKSPDPSEAQSTTNTAVTGNPKAMLNSHKQDDLRIVSDGSHKKKLSYNICACCGTS